MAPVSASKAARMAKKAEKKAEKGESSASSSVKGSSTPTGKCEWSFGYKTQPNLAKKLSSLDGVLQHSSLHSSNF